ncbi:MAG: DNA polymerase I, partial [candidate division Zixibacteria bacterium]|nr:DNA polymerase I [candidate division Zixibacteria bacterium]
RKLVTIDRNVSMPNSIESLKIEKPDFEKAKKLFMELEFRGLLDELAKQSGHLDLKLGEGDSKQTKADKDVEYICVDTIPKLKKMLDEFKNIKEIAVDTETTSLNTQVADLVGISLCAKAGRAFYLPIGHDDTKRNLPRKESSKLIQKLLTDKKIQKIGQNIKYDLEVLHRARYDIDPISFDTMIASYVLSPSGRRHGLNSLAFEFFNYSMQPISDLIGKGAKQKTFNTVDVNTAVFYAAEDADYTYRLRGVLAPQIDKLELQNLYYNIENPLIKVLAAMEEEGVRVDADLLGKMSLDMEAQLHKLTNDIYSEAGQEFNINSTQQLSKILFEDLKLPTKGKTAKKTGYSTDVKVLEELAEIHDLPKFILDYRQLAKLKSTYIDAIPRLINKETGRVHTSYNQTIAATGRLSSTEPNLQNIPIRTEIGRQIRKAFIPRDKNYELLLADYSQVELRILAHITGDETLINAFKNNEDIHSRTAAEVYGADINNVSPEMRRAAKTANFAIIYGVSAYGLSQQTELNLGESKDFIDTYLARYPGIKNYMDNSIKFARENGYVKTLLNRIRYLPEINAKNYQVRQFAERIAINTPIQGTAADMIKIAMITIYKKMENMKSKMILQVHDELVFDMFKEESDKLQKIVRDGMEKALKLKVPIVADMGIGPNWLEAK